MRKLIGLILLSLFVVIPLGAQSFNPATVSVPLALTAGAAPVTLTLTTISFCVWIKNTDATNSATVAVNGGSNHTIAPTEVYHWGCDSNFAVKSITYARVGGSNVVLKGAADEFVP